MATGSVLSACDLEVFAGPVVPVSQWPAIDVSGKRIGVLVVAHENPDVLLELVRRADLVKVFDRRPAQVLPPTPLAGRVARVPGLTRPVGRWHRRLAIRDKEQRRQLAPGREGDVVVSSRWYRALRQPNCQLISWPLTEITARGVRTADGVEHLVDMLVTA